MKKRTILISSLSILGALNLSAAKVQLSEVPAAVRQALEDRAGGANIEDIDRETRNGVVTYEAAFKKDGRHQEVLLNESGQVLSISGGANAGSLGSSSATPRSSTSNRGDDGVSGNKRSGFAKKLENREVISFSELPQNVRSTIRDYTDRSRIQQVWKGTLEGQTIYQVSYQNGGQDNVLRVKESGEILKLRRDGYVSQNFAVPLTGAREVSMSELPEPVREKVRSFGGSVEHILAGDLNGQRMYEVSLVQGTKEAEARIKSDGSVHRYVGEKFSGSRVASNESDSEWQDRRSDRQERRSNRVRDPILGVGGAETGSSGAVAGKVNMEDLPRPVRRAINEAAEGAQIEDIDRNTRQGRVTYEAAFKKNGKHNELLVAEDGSVIRRTVDGKEINEPAGAAADTSSLKSGKVTIDEVPAAVRRAIRDEAGSAQIEDIDRQVKNGKVTYEAAFKKDGKHTELTVSDDGQVLSR